MQSFLYEVVARIVAIYLCVDCYRRIRNGLVERKIKIWNDSLLIWSSRFADRDATPVQFWMQIFFQGTGLVACLVIAICGWFHPNA